MGLMASFIRRKIKVAPFKIGPDFIDPGHHTRITGSVSRNLDGWMLPKSYNIKSAKKASLGADMIVAEGVMGLFDGYDGKTEAGSTAQMAKWLGLPVILVVDAKSMARSVAALVTGFERFDPALDFAGVVFNNIGSPRHLAYLKDALYGNVNMPCLGGIPGNSKITIPERHLGLVTRDEHILQPGDIKALADIVDENMDVENLIARLPNVSFPGYPDYPGYDERPMKPDFFKVRIGVAKDKAFCFYYQDNIDILKSFGAEIFYFSPIKDEKLPDNLDGLYFGGGYPELFAKKLYENKKMRKAILEKSQKKMPIYGECGGFMYLCKKIYLKDKTSWEMTGCFPFETAMSDRLRSLGYREITLAGPNLLGEKGLKIRGHEFHYSEITEPLKEDKIKRVYRVSDRMGQNRLLEGFFTKRTLGSYIHIHLGSQPDAAKNFIKACAQYHNEREKG